MGTVKAYNTQLEDMRLRVARGEIAVGPDAARRLAAQTQLAMQPHPLPALDPKTKVLPWHERRKAAVVDIQGTLINVDAIRHLVEGKVKYFDEFHEQTMAQPINEEILEEVREDSAKGLAILFLTGMTERFRHPLGWYLGNHDVPGEGLWMRPNHLFVSDVALKTWRYREISRQFQVVKATDDNPNILALWEELEIPVIRRVPGWREV